MNGTNAKVNPNIAPILEGRKEHPNALRFTREARAKNRPTRESIRRPKAGRKLAPV
jgi:hypothetical protein